MWVFDSIRKKWLQLTAEEWVRQHVINFLITEKKIPAGLISIEKELVLNGIRKRYDIVVYSGTEPWLIVECKAPYIALDADVVAQAQRYNLVVQAHYLMISNGVSDLVFDRRNEVVELPSAGTR